MIFASAMLNFGVRQLLGRWSRSLPPDRTYVGERRRPRGPSTRSALSCSRYKPAWTSHRDRLAFMRIVSGEFERGMVVTHAQTGKTVPNWYAQAVFGRDRSTVDRAYPGDGGSGERDRTRPGDSLFTGPKVQFPPIPSFAPEHFSSLRATTADKYKQFRKGMDQLDSEGVVQVLRNDLRAATWHRCWPPSARCSSRWSPPGSNPSSTSIR